MITIETVSEDHASIMQISDQKLRGVPKGFDECFWFPYTYICGEEGFIKNCPIEGRLEIYWSQE